MSKELKTFADFRANVGREVEYNWRESIDIGKLALVDNCVVLFNNHASGSFDYEDENYQHGFLIADEGVLNKAVNKFAYIKVLGEYVYLETDFQYPAWWTGKPIKCRFFDQEGEEGLTAYLVGINPVDTGYPYIDNNRTRWKHAKPIEKQRETKTEMFLTIVKDGKESKVKLSEDLIKEIKEKMEE